MSAAMERSDAEIGAVRGVRDVLLTTGGFAGSQVNSASIYVRIAPHEERIFSLGRLARETLRLRPWRAFQGNFSQSEVMSEIDARLAKFKEIRAQVRNYPSFNVGGGSFDVNFIIRGPELSELYGYGEELRKRAMEAGGFRGLDTSLRLNKPELHVDIDRDRAADLGVSARDIGTALRVMVGGDEEVSRFRDPSTNEQYEVRLRLMEDDRNRPEIIDQLKLPSASGTLVELGSVASVDRVESASRIDRLDRQRMVSVRGGVAPGYALGDRIDVMKDLAAELGMPQTYTTSVTGRSRELERTFTEFALAFLLSIVFMYLILASQFESLTHPLTILALAAALDPVRAALGVGLRRHAQRLQRARHPRALRRRQEERDSADRPHEHAAGPGHAARRGHPASESRSAAPDPDDHALARRRHGAARRRQRAGRRGAPRRRRGRRRRPDALPAADAARHAGRLLGLRRSRSRVATHRSEVAAVAVDEASARG